MTAEIYSHFRLKQIENQINHERVVAEDKLRILNQIKERLDWLEQFNCKQQKFEQKMNHQYFEFEQQLFEQKNTFNYSE